MGTITSVRLWTVSGAPLLADITEDEPAGYRRRLIGFLPPEERDAVHGALGRGGDVGPPDEDYCSCGGEAEGVWIHGDPETFEEDGGSVEDDE